MDWAPLLLTFRLAAIATLILFFLAIPLGYWLAFTKVSVKPLIEALVSMPLVLPPTVLGFYLLITFSPGNFLGQWIEEVLGIRVVFSFLGLLIASILYSLPFMVHPIQAGLSNLPISLSEAAFVLGKSKTETLIKVLLPNIKSSLLTGIVLTFAHTVGEFGVVLMIGGNIPNQTRVASITIYDQVESLNYGSAHQYSFILFTLSFSTLTAVYLINGGYLKQLWQ